ncbi:MAG: hypothetical protein H2056_00530 [Sphingopyxis sp.]|nr:hypothetical protein [Sphingopyxis sp.]
MSLFDGTFTANWGDIPPHPFAKVDFLPDGRLAVVQLRGRNNLYIYGPDDSLLLQADVGDGVEAMCCTAHGAIWISYFDEGIFGTNQLADGSWPPASTGLACFNESGVCVWRADNAGLEIDDCYAMTSNASDVWICAYSDFNIVHISNEQATVWTNDIVGAHAIAASGDYILLAGGYASKGDQDKVWLLRLVGNRAELLNEASLTGLGTSRAFGRDGVLHFITNNQWHRVNVSEWAAQSAAD